VDHLIHVLRKLVQAGNTVIVIEHNLDVIKTADHIIDLGPEGGEEGGKVVAFGSVSQVMENPQSHTGRYLAEKIRKDEKRLRKPFPVGGVGGNPH
jgi:excinuclease ABC subunit A